MSWVLFCKKIIWQLICNWSNFATLSPWKPRRTSVDWVGFSRLVDPRLCNGRLPVRYVCGGGWSRCRVDRGRWSEPGDGQRSEHLGSCPVARWCDDVKFLFCSGQRRTVFIKHRIRTVCSVTCRQRSLCHCNPAIKSFHDPIDRVEWMN